MMEIRPDQIQMFLDRVRTGFVARVANYLKTHHREWLQDLDKNALEDLIRRQISAAESYGISTEIPVVQFIETGLALGEKFHSSGKYPEVEKILLQEIDGAVKAQQMQEAVKRGLKAAEG